MKKSDKRDNTIIGEGIVGVFGGIGAHKLLLGVETLALGESLGFIGWCGVAIFHAMFVLKAAGGAINMYSMLRDAITAAADTKRKREEEASDTVTITGEFRK